jgi:signal transduction histidine kinase/DNA-binding response OmpR family regulator
MQMPDEPTNVLVVDDLPEQLLVYRTILEELGQNLVMVRSGEDALRAVLRDDFAVILLDVNMPGMSGLETAALIRKRRRSAHTPIIFITAFADEMRVTEGYAQGAVDYITTPVIPTVLRAKVSVFTDLYRMTQQVKRQAEERIALAEERSRREAAEEANRQLTFLARAGAVLGQSLDPEVTARDVVRLPLPLLADSAVLVTLHSDGKPAKYHQARVDSHAVQEGPGGGYLERHLVNVAKWEGCVSVTTEHGSGFAFPLQIHGQTFAVLGFLRSSSRPFHPADLNVADTFASRAASALENARLYQEVQQANRQKNEFLSMLAHELRNPLAPIRNATAILGQNHTDPVRIEWARGVIDRQISHVVRLVDDLLDVSRLTLGKIRLVIEHIDVEEVVTQAVETVRPLANQFRHQLEVTFPQNRVRVMGDKVRLTQVFTNLLHNAVKYTEPGGRICIGLGSEANNAIVRVRDTGVGISADLLPSVFDLFTQANRSLDRAQGGLGVGLTLVRRLVELHEGTVEALSEGPNRGSEFVVRLPACADTVETQTTTPGTASQKISPLRVVVVDDNEDGADSLASLLELLGHEVRVAYDGPTGITAVRGFDPHLVLLDIGLPGIDGYEVARRLRHDPGTRPVLVAVSGYGRDEDRQLAHAAGFQHHFVKPIEFETIQTLLASVVAARNGSCGQS